MAARAMGNFALSRLRIVNPRDGWPNVAAQRAASGADQILESAELFDTVEQAVADLTLLFATTARAHDQAKPVVAPADAAREIVAHVAGPGASGGVGILFGRERYGLQNEEVALANRIITFPVNPGFASLNLAQAVLLIGYEWFKLSTGGALAVRDARTLRAGLPAPDAGLLRQSGPGTRQGRIPAPGREARDHAGQSAQHLHPDGPDQAGHAHPARGGDGDRRGPQGSGQGRRARRRTGDAAARAAGRTRPGAPHPPKAAPSAGWPGCCAATRPTPSGCCGRR